MSDPKCKLCRGTGDNETGINMKVNNHICPRCGGYGTVPESSDTYDNGNVKTLTAKDNGYIDNNGRVEA